MWFSVSMAQGKVLLFAFPAMEPLAEKLMALNENYEHGMPEGLFCGSKVPLIQISGVHCGDRNIGQSRFLQLPADWWNPDPTVRGETSSGDKFVGKTSFLSLVLKFSPRRFFAQFAALCTSVAEVARYCCAVVGSQSVCHGRSSCVLGSKKLVVSQN